MIFRCRGGFDGSSVPRRTLFSIFNFHFSIFSFPRQPHFSLFNFQFFCPSTNTLFNFHFFSLPRQPLFSIFNFQFFLSLGKHSFQHSFSKYVRIVISLFANQQPQGRNTSSQELQLDVVFS